MKLFSLVASSASVERSFKLQGHVHSKTRNSLCHEKVQKLVAIKINAPLIHQYSPDQFKEDESVDDIGDTVYDVFDDSFQFDLVNSYDD